MANLVQKSFRVLPLLLALLLSVMPWQIAHAMPGRQEAKQIRIEVQDGGFNGSPDELDIQVEQNQLVNLTFVWAHKAYIQDEHIFVLDGYKLETPKLNSQNREGTLKFIADKLGTFSFHCDLECDAHGNLQRGFLKVVPSTGGAGGGSAAARLATTLSVKPSTTLVATGELVNLMTTLRANDGTPVPQADIQYFVDTEFGGVKGKMNIGHAKTDANGVAFFDYQPALSATQQNITAQFDSMGLYDQATQSVSIQLVGQPLPAYTTAPIGLEPFREVAPYGLAALVLSIWATFGFVMFQALSIARRPRR